MNLHMHAHTHMHTHTHTHIFNQFEFSYMSTQEYIDMHIYIHTCTHIHKYAWQLKYDIRRLPSKLCNTKDRIFIISLGC